jgi:1-acyl-sn-glycerol-3-phosphate acyltransferase
MQPLKPGVLLLIKRCSAPIVPVGVAGAYDAWPRWRRYPRLAPLCAPAGKATLAVSVGPPIDPFSINQLARERALEELFKKLSMQQQRAERLRRK